MDGGPAPAPSAQAVPSWTSGAKDLVMTALGSSRVWATTGQGIFTEIYWPAVDQPQVKDLGFLIGGTGWGWHGSRDSTQENCGVFTAGICAIVTCTLLLSCSSSVRTDSVNPLMACLAPQ